MIENTVQDYTDADAVGFFHKLGQVRFRSEHGIDLEIVCGGIFVVEVAHENRIQVNAFNAQVCCR